MKNYIARNWKFIGLGIFFGFLASYEWIAWNILKNYFFFISGLIIGCVAGWKDARKYFAKYLPEWEQPEA